MGIDNEWFGKGGLGRESVYAMPKIHLLREVTEQQHHHL